MIDVALIVPLYVGFATIYYKIGRLEVQIKKNGSEKNDGRFSK